MDFLAAIWDFVSQHVALTLSILLIVAAAIKLIYGGGSDASAHRHDHDAVKKEAELARMDAINDVKNRYSKPLPGRRP
jgi:hypothetical protein